MNDVNGWIRKKIISQKIRMQYGVQQIIELLLEKYWVGLRMKIDGSGGNRIDSGGRWLIDNDLVVVFFDRERQVRKKLLEVEVVELLFRSKWMSGRN